MALYYLQPKNDPRRKVGLSSSTKWRGRNFGMIVRAASKEEARRLANESDPDAGIEAFWLSQEMSNCILLEHDGNSEVLMIDIGCVFDDDPSSILSPILL